MGCGCTLAAASVLCVVVLACITPMFVCHDDLQQALSEVATFIQDMGMSAYALCMMLFTTVYTSCRLKPMATKLSAQ